MPETPSSMTRRTFAAASACGVAALCLPSATALVPTGLPSLDRALGGGLPSAGLVALSACPGGRQTAIATDIALGVARRARSQVVYSSWHQPPKGVLDVIVARELKGSPHSVRKGLLTDGERLRARLLLLGLRDELSFARVAAPVHEQVLAGVLTGSLGGIQVLDRLDDMWNIYDERGDGPGDLGRPGGFCTETVLDHLRQRARASGSLILAVANADWPPGMPYPTHPAQVTMWKAVDRLADVHIRFGPPPPGGRGLMQFQVSSAAGSGRGTVFSDQRSSVLRWG